MGMPGEIEADFEEILADGFASTLTFSVGRGAGTLVPVSVQAMVSETTMQALPELGGVRQKRSFTATVCRSALCGEDGKEFLPKSGELVAYGDEMLRVSTVKVHPESPLVEIEFSEK